MYKIELFGKQTGLRTFTGAGGTEQNDILHNKMN
jgi:hypothetical protein